MMQSITPPRVFVCTDHAGHYPVGVASVVVAHDEQQARMMLEDELCRIGLEKTAFTLVEVDRTRPSVRVLNDGNY